MDTSEVKRIKSRVKGLNSLTEEERKFLISYYRNGKNLSKTVDKSKYRTWQSWLKTHQGIFYKLEHNNSTALCLSVANAQTYVLQESTELINRLKKEDLIKASPHIIKTLELISNVTGLANRTIEVKHTADNETLQRLHQLSDEQLEQLSSIVAEGAKKLEYATSEVVEPIRIESEQVGAGSDAGSGVVEVVESAGDEGLEGKE